MLTGCYDSFSRYWILKKENFSNTRLYSKIRYTNQYTSNLDANFYTTTYNKGVSILINKSLPNSLIYDAYIDLFSFSYLHFLNRSFITIRLISNSIQSFLQFNISKLIYNIILIHNNIFSSFKFSFVKYFIHFIVS